MTIAEFDHLPEKKKRELLTQCCGSSAWVNKMLTVFPVEDLVEFLEYAEQKWNECTEQEQMEAFEHHPKIGDINSLKEKFADTAGWAAGEQSGVNNSNENTLQQLAKANEAYENKFGFIFIICATGRSAEEMLADLNSRINSSKQEEIKTAAAEQLKITKLRLEKLFGVNESSKTYEL
jgi:2-oxo-4-hydroxy-4-carboxy-5-ureidoimidazoline decarboxylase